MVLTSPEGKSMLNDLSPIVLAFRMFGEDRVTSVLMALLSTGASFFAKEITQMTGLRQPEVSVGMRELMNRGWVEAEIVPHDTGRGRPRHRYHLFDPVTGGDCTAIFEHYVSQMDLVLQETKDAGLLIARRFTSTR